jgi:hypothetical protein
MKELLEQIDLFGNKDIILYDESTGRKFEIKDITINKYCEIALVFESEENEFI